LKKHATPRFGGCHDLLGKRDKASLLNGPSVGAISGESYERWSFAQESEARRKYLPGGADELKTGRFRRTIGHWRNMWGKRHIRVPPGRIGSLGKRGGGVCGKTVSNRPGNWSLFVRGKCGREEIPNPRGRVGAGWGLFLLEGTAQPKRRGAQSRGGNRRKKMSFKSKEKSVDVERKGFGFCLRVNVECTTDTWYQKRESVKVRWGEQTCSS